jgi:hypothetical protein
MPLNLHLSHKLVDHVTITVYACVKDSIQKYPSNISITSTIVQSNERISCFLHSL